jgi:hypothetical protein
MKEIYKAGVTPQQKLVAINNKFGNTSVKNQQGTTRILYDTIPYTNQTTIRFFEDSSSRTFPLSNTGSEGNKLGVGDTMVIAQLLFSWVRFSPSTNEWSAQSNLLGFSSSVALAYVNVEIANNQVIKKLTLSEANTAYNKDTTAQDNTLDLETSIVIPPLLPFVVELNLPEALSVPSGSYLECQIIGVGGIIAPRTTF